MRMALYILHQVYPPLEEDEAFDQPLAGRRDAVTIHEMRHLL